MAPELAKIACATPSSVEPAPQKLQRLSSGSVSFSCRDCNRRKVKCDRAKPNCSTCVKHNLPCIYQEPARRQPRKRRHSESVHDRLARYEEILRENNLLESSQIEGTTSITTPPARPRAYEDAVLVNDTRSASTPSFYMSSQINLNAQAIITSHDSKKDSGGFQYYDAVDAKPFSILPSAVLSLGMTAPSSQDSIKLWDIYVSNVDPICKVIHVPTFVTTVHAILAGSVKATPGQQCLLCAAHYLAVFSLQEAECMTWFQQEQSVLLSQQEARLKHSLEEAQWLKSTDLAVLQAFVLYLIACKSRLDHSTFWILTGIGTRIAQRMGLHRDDQGLNVSPFEAEMRRRVFWQLLPLDGFAGQHSGTGISLPPGSWDTKQPSNINDDQLWPAMKHLPRQQEGPTDMILFLMRTELSNLYNRRGIKMGGLNDTVQFKAAGELDRLVDEVEAIIEDKYLRYCDIADPLHFLTVCTARSAANVVRLRGRMQPLLRGTMPASDQKNLYAIACKVIDTDNMLHQNSSVQRFQWHIKSFFLWDVLICILMSIAKAELLSSVEREAAWQKISDVYRNRPHYLELTDPFQEALHKVTLKSWKANPSSQAIPPPFFIQKLLDHSHALQVEGGSESKASDHAETVALFFYEDSTFQELLDSIINDQYIADLGPQLDFGELNAQTMLDKV